MNKLHKTILLEALALLTIIGICVLIGYVFVEHSLPAMRYK